MTQDHPRYRVERQSSLAEFHGPSGSGLDYAAVAEGMDLIKWEDGTVELVRDTRLTDVEKAIWTTAYVNSLPDSAFLFIEAGGKKDKGGKTVPRGLRHFPVKDASGKLDLAHVRNAIARIPQSKAKGLNKKAVQTKARSLYAQLRKKTKK